MKIPENVIRTIEAERELAESEILELKYNEKKITPANIKHERKNVLVRD